MISKLKFINAFKYQVQINGNKTSSSLFSSLKKSILTEEESFKNDVVDMKTKLCARFIDNPAEHHSFIIKTLNALSRPLDPSSILISLSLLKTAQKNCSIEDIKTINDFLKKHEGYINAQEELYQNAPSKNSPSHRR